MSLCNIEFNSDNAETAKKSLAIKQVKGLEVVIGKRNQLMIDYDVDEFPQERFNKGMNYLEQRLNPFSLFETIKYDKYHSKSGTHWHVIIELPVEFEDIERIVWQQIFGSDFQRDALSVIGISRNVKNPILLFMKQDKNTEESGFTIIKNKIGRKFKE